jgi:signal transduction histidine kinase
VILSAGENVRDGLPEGRSAFMEQGSVITDQANQLMELVDQVLRFAATAKGAGRPDLSPIQVGVLVESALQNTADLVQRAAFRVEKRIPGDLPNVVGEMSGLVQSLQNLIINAVKYSDRDRWIGISAGTGTDSNGRREVRISVADHGTGIASSELTQIFEPFYRSPHAISGQVRGTGLGLAIAKRHAEGCGGRLSVVSEVGVGSVFTLHLPADEEDSILTPLVPEAKTRFHQ